MEKTEVYKKKLEEAAASLKKEVAALEIPPDFGDFPGEDDETDESAAKYNQLSASGALKFKLAETEEALRRIEAGTYGICKSCGKEISAEVLDALPESELCQECKEKMKK